MILTSRAAPFEIDFNMHKSNSTYFADFDIARLHLMVRLCGLGLKTMSEELYIADGRKGPKRLHMGMGGVHLNFRKEIRCWQGFEMWTQILCWDRKWFYLVTWFVEKGAVKPTNWTLQPWRNKQRSQGPDIMTGDEVVKGKEEMKSKGAHPAIFATGIAKYVCKRGRLTVPPERILQASELLPPKPKEHKTPPMTDSPAVPVEGDALPAAASVASAAIQDATSSAADDLLNAALNAKPMNGDDWDWARVEQERLRGLKIAEAWCQTEALGEEFPGDERPALGKWWDFPGI